MPLSSMTGFGQAEKTTPSGGYRVEIRSVNNRFLELQFRTPRALHNLEARFKKLLSQHISRGSITVAITWDKENVAGQCAWNRDAVAEYIRILKEIRTEFKLEGELTLSHVLEADDLIKISPVSYSDATLWKHIGPILTAAIEDFQKHRETEARFLERELRAMIKNMTANLHKIEVRLPMRIAKQNDELTRRIKALAGDQVDPQRLATEVALMVDKMDISEECTRLRAHIDKFSDDLRADEPTGKRLGFLLQEMNREANTIGSKANDTEISHLSVELKEYIEKIREQIQNIE
jgi:uncharacterized protein (TIGR00255 family)